ncbi:MAG: TlpA disulfide reductase family protein [Thermodesulfobacteriota bacterium]
MRRIFTLTALLGLFLFTVSCNEGTKESSAENDNNVAKNFSLESLNGNNEISLEDFKSKAVVINFWASWCGPCKLEIPFFEKTWRKYKDKEVVFIGIDVMDDKDSAVNFIEELGISYINLYDPSGKTSNSYGVIALPATFFIDKNGNIAVKHYGSFIGKQSEKAFKSYLKEIME